MNSKYGEFPDEQMLKHVEVLKKDVFRLLCMKEENSAALEATFDAVLWKLKGYNEVFEYHPVMVDIICLLERARSQAHSIHYSHTTYRKCILDCMSLLDLLVGGDTNA